MKEARAIDASITEKTVKDWKATLEAKKTKDSGYNSFRANDPFEEFQVDLLFFTQEGEQEPKYEVEAEEAEEEAEEEPPGAK